MRSFLSKAKLQARGTRSLAVAALTPPLEGWYAGVRAATARERVLQLVVVSAALLSLGAGRLPEWVRHVESGSELRRIFFQTVELPGGPVDARRPPAQTRAALTSRLASQGDRLELHALRAREAERELDFEAAEQDWQTFAERSQDPAELAEFYCRRGRAQDEANVRLAQSFLPAGPADALLPDHEQTAWKAFERIVELIDRHGLDRDFERQVYSRWTQRYPSSKLVYERHLDLLVSASLTAEAQALVDDFSQRFPDDRTFAVSAGARIAGLAGGDDAELAAYEGAYDPLWPEQLIQRYFNLLERAQRLRERQDQARARLAADPDDLAAATWIFHYRRRQGDFGGAAFALKSFEQSKDQRGANWTAGELETIGVLYRQVNNFNEAARCYYALYSLPGAADRSRELALAGLAELLLGAPEQQIRLGARDFDFYRDVATMDENPGLLNGVLSLLFNSEQLPYEYDRAAQSSIAYYNRAKAAELLGRLRAEFPDSGRLAPLEAKLIQAYSLYGENEAVISRGGQFLEAYPGAAQRTDVAFSIAEAHARREDPEAEFAVYDRLLADLAAKSDQVPLGRGTLSDQIGGSRWLGGPRSPDYARVLDRYVSRLVALQRLPQALRIHAQEIARNPDDPGLYERLAGFLDVNGLSEQVEGVYRQAMARFDDRSWHHKLARWYLRRQRAAEFESLTREVTDAFSGTELEAYFAQTLRGGPTPRIYLQLNLYAHNRFPRNLAFVRNLIRAYRNRETRDAGAERELLRRYWLHSDDLRTQYLAAVTRAGELDSHLASLKGVWAETSAAAQFYGEAQAWRAHFEEAAPALLVASRQAPGDEPHVARSASLHRSLADTEVALELAQNLAASEPLNRQRLALAGDVLADRGALERAAPLWDRMAQTEPGAREGYLDAATVFWDYYQFDDALRLLREGRTRLAQPALYAYEAGAIYEGKADPDGAVKEYLQGALAGEPDYQSRQRLVNLSRREEYHDRIESATQRLAETLNPSTQAVALRVDTLAAQQRNDDIEALLTSLAADTTSHDLLRVIDDAARVRNLSQIQVSVLERRVELTRDPVEKMRQRLALMRLHESLDDDRAADREIAGLYAENGRTLGIVRASADYLWRSERRPEAIGVLLEAAGVSYPELARRFRLEAAGKAIETEQFEQAREIAGVLLAEAPFDVEAIAITTDSFANEGDDEGLREFYESKLAESTDRALTARLRRGLIPALSRLEDHSGAIDQYIELINSFPEDPGLTTEAALYAADHGQREKLVDFYMTTTQQSPRDVRFQRVLARVHVALEEYRQAIAAYGRALGVRPDSVADWESLAALQVRQMRFDDALKSYGQLYEVSHKEPRWKERMAELHARLGDAPATLTALREALIEGRPERPANFFRAAERLESWGILDEALALAEEGVVIAGDRLLVDYTHLDGARCYARLMTRLRRHDEAIRSLKAAWPREQRDYLPDLWRSIIEETLVTAERYFVGQEREDFLASLDSWRADADGEEFRYSLLPAAQSAGLAQVEAKWLFDAVVRQPDGSQADHDRGRLIELQRSWLKHAELGGQLERIWNAHPTRNQEKHILIEAAEAYRAAGDEDAEFGVLGQANSTSERYLALLGRRDSDGLLALAARSQAALSYAVVAGDSELATRAIAGYRAQRPPVWKSFYGGLAAVYHDDIEAPAFAESLGSRAIADQLGSPVNREVRLAGDAWYYLASRYGEIGADDYLLAGIESAPSSAGAYFRLAEVLAEHDETEEASAQYRLGLQLAPLDARAHSDLADLLWDSGQSQQATEHWREAARIYTRRAEQSRWNSTFWDDVAGLIRVLAEHGQVDPLRTEIDGFFEAYIRRSGMYRIEELARALVESSPTPNQETARLFEWAELSPAPEQYLGAFARAQWLDSAHREEAFEQTIRLAEARAASVGPQQRYQEQSNVARWQAEKLEFLLNQDQLREAIALQAAGGESLVELLSYQRADLALELAARTDSLDSTLELLASEPSGQTYLETAARLRDRGLTADARRLLDFHYSGRLARRDLSPASFLGLAEVRFEQGRIDDAEALLRRLTSAVGEPFGHHLAAAGVLTENGRSELAIEFVETRVKAVPWDNEARLQLAQLRDDADGLAKIAGDLRAPAKLRTAASGDDGIATIESLREHLATRPSDAEGRMDLVRLALGADRHRLAVAAIEPLLRGSSLAYELRQPDSIFDERPVSSLSPYEADRFLAQAGVSRSDRAELAAGLGRSLESLGGLRGAFRAYQIAERLEGASDRLEPVRRGVELMAENARRRPVIHETVEYSRDVRAKLSGGVR